MPTSARKALLVGIDGCNLGRIDSGVRAPTLRRLRAEARFAPSRIYPDGRTMTVSGPGWSTILTGVWPQKHGVLDNDIEGHALATYPDLITRATGLQTFYAASWPPLHEQILTREVTRRFTVSREDMVACDREVAGEAAAALTGDLDLGFVYFGSPDEEAHTHGALSAQYDAAIEAVDGYLGQLLDTIAARPSRADEDWLILVTTDHGHRPEGGHGGQTDAERSTFVIGHGDGIASGPSAWEDSARIVDIAPTLLEHVGVRVDPAWDLDGRTLLEGELNERSR